MKMKELVKKWWEKLPCPMDFWDWLCKKFPKTYPFICFMAYLLIGTGFYYWFEHDEEQEVIAKELVTRKTFADKIHAIIKNRTLVGQDLDEIADDVLVEFAQYMDKDSNFFISGVGLPAKITHVNCFFLSFSTLSTIGYGNIYPTHTASRLFTMIYAFLGIPLYAMTLSHVGEIFAYVFMEGYYNFKVDMLTVEKREQMEIERYKAMGIKRAPEDIERTRRLRRWISIKFLGKIMLFIMPGILLMIVLPAILIARVEQWGFVQAVYYAFISQTTIGYGDFVAGVKDNVKSKVANAFYQTFLFLWLFLGLSYIAMIIRFVTDFISSRKLLKIEAALIQRLRLKRGKVWSDRMLNFKFFQRLAEELQLHKQKKQPLTYSPQMFLADWQSCIDLRELDRVIEAEFEAAGDAETLRKTRSFSDIHELAMADMKGESVKRRGRWVLRDEAKDEDEQPTVHASEILSRLVLALGYEPPCSLDDEETDQQQQQQVDQSNQSVYDTVRSVSIPVGDWSSTQPAAGLDAINNAVNANTITSMSSYSIGGGFSNLDDKTITQDESVFVPWSTTVAATNETSIPADSKWDLSSMASDQNKNADVNMQQTSAATTVAARLANRAMRPRSNSEHFANKQLDVPSHLYRNDLTWYGAPAAKEFNEAYKQSLVEAATSCGYRQRDNGNSIVQQLEQQQQQLQQQQTRQQRLLPRFLRKWSQRQSIAEEQLEHSYNRIEEAMKRDAETFDELPEDSTIIDVIELQERLRSQQIAEQMIEEAAASLNPESMNVLEQTSVADLMRALALISAGGDSTGDEKSRKPLLLDDHQFLSITGRNGVGLAPLGQSSSSQTVPYRKYGTAQAPPEKGLEKLLSLFVPPAGASASTSQQQCPSSDLLTEEERQHLRSRRATQGNADLLGLRSRFSDRRFSLRPMSFAGNSSSSDKGSGSFSRGSIRGSSSRRYDDHHLIESCPKRSLVQTESRPGISSPVAKAAAKKAARRFSVRPVDLNSPIGSTSGVPAISSFVETDPAGPYGDSPRSSGRYDRQQSLQTGPIPRWKAGILQKGASAFKRTRAFSLSELDKSGTSGSAASGGNGGSSSRLAISPLAMTEDSRGMTVSQRLFTNTQKTVTIVTPKSSARGLGQAVTLSPPEVQRESGNEADHSSDSS